MSLDLQLLEHEKVGFKTKGNKREIVLFGEFIKQYEKRTDQYDTLINLIQEDYNTAIIEYETSMKLENQLTTDEDLRRTQRRETMLKAMILIKETYMTMN